MQSEPRQLSFPTAMHWLLLKLRKNYKFPAHKEHLILRMRTARSSDSLSWKVSNPIGASPVECCTATIQCVWEIALD